MSRQLRSLGGSLILTTVFVLFVFLAPAHAWYSSTGAGSRAGAVGALTAPGSVSATQSSNQVTVTFTAAARTSGGAVTGYAITRSDGVTICGSPTLQTGLTCTDTTAADGATYTYTVTARLGGFSSAATSNAITVAQTPTLTSTPSAASAAAAPSFAFSGPSDATSYQCALDAGAYAACTSPASYSAVADGSHTFHVRALAGASIRPAASYTWTVDSSAPTVSSSPANPSTSASATFTFTHAEASYTFTCALDNGSASACTSPKTYASLADGSHSVTITAVAPDGSQTTARTYTWTVDTTAPTDALSLASGATNVALNSAGTVLYYRGGAAGSFKLTDTVSDAGTGPASVSFPAIAATGWTHGAETVTSGTGTGPIAYTSQSYGYTASPANPTATTVTSKDQAGNTSGGATLSFVSDTTAPAGGALTVNGTAASAGGTSSVSTGTAFAIGTRSDWVETQGAAASGLATSTLTVVSESLSGTTCGAPGSAGPYPTATTITGTTQPGGLATGYCYLYTLAGTDRVGNTTAISTTVRSVAGPSLTSLSPATLPQTASGVTVTVTGSGFVAGAVTATITGHAGVTVNSATYVNATTLRLNVSVAGTAPVAADYALNVTNGDGGSASKASAFAVTAAPTITAPTASNQYSLAKGGTTGSTTITGTGFEAGATVTFSGGFTLNSATVNNSGSITINVTSGPANQKGTYNLTVTNPDGSSVTSTGSMTVS